MVCDLRFSNELPVEHMWRTLEPRVESVRRDLAREFGCDPEQMAITRNASESNLTMILGSDFARGDEAIITTQNYPRMQSGWAQREARDGLVVKRIRMRTPVPSTADFVDRIAEAITPRTRAIEVMHVNNQTGYVSPVREVVALGRRHGIPVFVDGAHAFAHCEPIVAGEWREPRGRGIAGAVRADPAVGRRTLSSPAPARRGSPPPAR